MFTVLFTVFLTNPGGLWDGLHDGLAYWLAQHGAGRGEKEWYFYLVVLFAEEWPVLLLGAVGAVAALRRPTLLRLFLIWDFLLSLAVYCWANERFSLARAAPAAAAAAARRRSACRRSGTRGPLDRPARPGGRAALRRVTGATSWRANVENGADPREFLVTTQSAQEVRDVRDRVYAVAERAEREGRDGSILVDSAEGATYPWAWYFRDLPVGYLDLSAAPAAGRHRRRDPDRGRPRAAPPDAGRLRRRRFPFRVWWVRDYGEMSPAAWWRWFARREPWNPTGGMQEWLYVRQGA